VKLQTGSCAASRASLKEKKPVEMPRFSVPAGRTYPRVAFRPGHFKPLLKSAELPAIRLYDLRHTCATISLIAGVSQGHQ